jgi:hypothetical protein
MTILERECSARGLRLTYLPITISHSGAGGGERRVYEDISIASSEGRVTIKGQRGSFEQSVIYETILVQGDHATKGELGALLRHLSKGPIQAPAEERGNERRDEVGLEKGGGLRPSADYSHSFRILIVQEGSWGRRIAEHLVRSAPVHWSMALIELPAELPPLIDEPGAFLPSYIPEADLVVFLSEHPSAGQLVSEVVRRSRARALIAPIDNSSWLLPGEVRSISRTLDEWGVKHVFPRPFCALSPQGEPAIDEFAARFGAPAVQIRSGDGRTVSEFIVRRGAPCGCTEQVAEQMIGVDMEEAVERAGLLHHHFPCLASMAREEDLDDTLMHVSGHLLRRGVEEQVRIARKGQRAVSYLEPGR